jgi:hypothetical protein
MAAAAPHTCCACFFSTDFPGVTIEADGRCSVCHQTRIGEELAAHLTSDLEELKRLAARWRAERTGRYDCIIGGSGGFDSSYVIYVAKRLLGLNPLVVKYDHGFNHEASDRNLRALCAALGVDFEIVRSRGRHDALCVRHMALAFRHTGLYWAVCVFCGHAIQSVIYRAARRERVTVVLGSHNIFEDRLHLKRSVKVGLLQRALRRTRAGQWPGMLWHLGLAAWHLLRLRLEFYVPPLSNLFARTPKVPAMRHVTVSRHVPWDVPAVVRALEEVGWRPPDLALPMRFDCLIEDSLINSTWRQAAGLTVQGVIACNLVHAGVRRRADLEASVAHYDAAIAGTMPEVRKRLGLRP